MMKKINQSKLARTLGVTPRHINRIFRRKQKPSVKLAQEIEKHTDIPWTSWFESAGEAVQPKTAVPNRETAVEELAEDTIDFGRFAWAVNNPDIDQKELISARDNLIENLHQTVAAKEKELWEKQNADLR